MALRMLHAEANYQRKVLTVPRLPLCIEAGQGPCDSGTEVTLRELAPIRQM